ncbi:hypothetical protein ACI2K4_26080 [Micromonospora sp. NPDC050397]|uniref:hypothetical protein n=1 Tax=Micromonospora sp. NPDC050397 TaxID=3364279 RepID=UPI00384E7C24
MTRYSILPSGARTSIVATWTGRCSDRSTEVTTVAAEGQALHLARTLTRLSEGAWHAAAWLDTHAAVEIGIAELIDQLRGATEEVDKIKLVCDGSRHVDQWSFIDIESTLAEALPVAMSGLTRAQRLTIADELSADAAGRAAALDELPCGYNPSQASSRAWQICEVTRSLRHGQIGALPEGAAAWLVYIWGPDLSPTERWAARDQLVRIEQLTAACDAHGGRGGFDGNAMLARLLMPPVQGQEEPEAFQVSVRGDYKDSWSPSPFQPMTVRRRLSVVSLGYEEIGELTPDDDEGFARLLGEWTRLVPYRR